MGIRTVFEFHVSRQARDRYQFDESLFGTDGRVVFANFQGARLFAQKMNAARDLVTQPELTVPAGHINAMGMLDEFLHLLVQEYRDTVNPAVMKQALRTLNQQFGYEQIEALLSNFCNLFPPTAVYNGEQSVDEYLQGQHSGIPNRELLLEELLFLWLANENPAFAPYRELFDDQFLAEVTAYRPVIISLQTYFETQPPFGPEQQSLISVLQIPAQRHPNSLSDQLSLIQSYFASHVGPISRRLLTSLDLMAEEGRVHIGVGGPGPVEVVDFKALAAEAAVSAPGEDLSDTEFAPEYEQFSPDLAWMPKLVLLAKNTYVWLDQLSKKYGHPIRRLNDIPDAELDEMAAAGLTGLWLIGLWERSEASKTIKHIMGKPDAVASAYSLYDYQIARGLGGDEAYDDLRRRARARGIRMSSDMVPNHMGIDSRWVVEHPDWFLSLPYSPYPSYTFAGQDLSLDSRVGIFLEDHYYDQTDAAVVFKRVDYFTGDTRYIYHGNDGTAMPWNDTAQLDFMNPAVREAVIQTILHVARRSSVIRFDAAMVLAKKHIQRLWHPTPGSGEGIASRAEFGLSRADFNERMPVEFWREVVDRVAQEVPDTLLLAEAFWLMEGYFVRTLGMHRVYNSAFMHMLRDERNQEYRLVIKNTLEFNPEILKRYVNFMNNPDEDTAIEQFGDGDKYFGVATLLATLPGLPMVGHGQIEGYTEKYGMEYQRAYYDEDPKPWLIERHQREIFPLFRNRHLFAEATHFRLYDFVGARSEVNENVFAYSNQAGSERSLVIYHNKWATAAGWIRRSVGYASARAVADEPPALQFTSLGEGLGLPNSRAAYVIFRDHLTDLEYLRNCADIHEQGLYIELGAYKAQVFLDFRVIYDDDDRRLTHLSGLLNGQGTSSISEALRELELADILQPYRALVNGSSFQRLIASQNTAEEKQAAVLAEVEQGLMALILAIQSSEKSVGESGATLAREICLTLKRALAEDPSRDPLAPFSLYDGTPAGWGTFFGWLLTHSLGRAIRTRDSVNQSRAWIDEWLFGKILDEALRETGFRDWLAKRGVHLIKVMTSLQGWYKPDGSDSLTAAAALERILADPDARHYMGVNRFDNILWYNQDDFASLRSWLYWISVIAPEDDVAASAAAELILQLADADEVAEYQVEKLRAALNGPNADEEE